ncbi:MAG: ferredoxin [Microgenomates group bacterium]|jgi:ferredoxin|nr:ferredoxin [Candidatus Woesebacteria bacterium]MBP6883602.1 ferredoxin [Candidatus Woesebacteria bacterium]
MTSNITQVKKGDVEIKVIRDKCIGAATCVVYAPSTFDLDEDNIAIIKNENWDRLEKIVAAAQSCPVLAIEVFVKGKKVYPK